jgi:rare lipoprotein A
LRPNFRPRGLRTAQLTIAATALALPASAFAFVGTTAPDSPARAALAIHVSPARVRVGQAITITGSAHRDRAVLAGGRIAVQGRVLPVAGARDVQLQGHAGDRWQTLASTRTGPAGRFSIGYRAQSGTNRLLRVRFAGDAANAGASVSVGTMTVYQPAIASWYYDAGRATGCGFNARYGVANTTLPCGTKVQFRYGGRTVMATVDDRGPYVSGRSWDLGQSTAGALGFQGVGTVWASVR